MKKMLMLLSVIALMVLAGCGIEVKKTYYYATVQLTFGSQDSGTIFTCTDVEGNTFTMKCDSITENNGGDFLPGYMRFYYCTTIRKFRVEDNRRVLLNMVINISPVRHLWTDCSECQYLPAFCYFQVYGVDRQTHETQVIFSQDTSGYYQVHYNWQFIPY